MHNKWEGDWKREWNKLRIDEKEMDIGLWCAGGTTAGTNSGKATAAGCRL